MSTFAVVWSVLHVGIVAACGLTVYYLRYALRHKTDYPLARSLAIQSAALGVYALFIINALVLPELIRDIPGIEALSAVNPLVLLFGSGAVMLNVRRRYKDLKDFGG